MSSVVDSTSEVDRLDIEDANLFLKLIITDADENQLKKKKAYQISKSNV